MLSSSSQLQTLLRSHFLFPAIVHIFSTLNTGDADISELLIRANCIVQEYFSREDTCKILDTANRKPRRLPIRLSIHSITEKLRYNKFFITRQIQEIMAFRAK